MQRKSNIMLHGLVEPPQEVLKFVDPDAQLDVRRVFRVGKSNRPNGRPRRVKIVPGSDAAVHQFLNSLKRKKICKPNSCIRLYPQTKRVEAEFERRKSDGESIRMKFVSGVPTIKPSN
ncbi:hypothetical protein WA026_014131 [Henosepilachna vigintioctopunctata]|uniref:Uncharacterized protein n=1 Tax=Henosepilachna vigintioctopunctata TaxID=420089 RepID=A0AAW1TUA5_9CUCU